MNEYAVVAALGLLAYLVAKSTDITSKLNQVGSDIGIGAHKVLNPGYEDWNPNDTRTDPALVDATLTIPERISRTVLPTPALEGWDPNNPATDEALRKEIGGLPADTDEPGYGLTGEW